MAFDFDLHLYVTFYFGFMFSVQKLFKFSICICITLILWKLFRKTEMQKDIIMTGIQKKVINTEIHILYSLLDRLYLKLWVFVAYFGRKILWSLTNGGLKINCKFWFQKVYKSTFISEFTNHYQLIWNFSLFLTEMSYTTRIYSMQWALDCEVF